MNVSLAIIDGLERLREDWEQSDGAAAVCALPGDLSPAERVAAAWALAMEGRSAGAGAPQRRLRRLARALTGDGAAQTPGEEKEPLLKRTGELRAAIEAAVAEKLWPLAPGDSSESPAQLARRWQAALPGLSPLRTWRMLARLGSPAVAPEAPLRRFLWRVGAIFDAGSSPAAFDAFETAALDWAAAARLEPEQLEAMLTFHTQGPAGGGGGHCGARARCAGCPFHAVCAWARFHPSGANPDAEKNNDGVEPLRRRLIEGREESLQTGELLAALMAGAGGGAALTPARALMKRFGSLREIERATAAELTSVHGISGGRAAAIKAALELGRRAARCELHPGDSIGCSEDVWRAFRLKFRNLPQEHFIVLALDAKHRVVGEHMISRGGLTSSLAHPREVFREAVRQAAAAVILLHNHPSGDPQPSPEDFSVTARLREAGEVLGIRVLDHIVLGEDDFYSFKDEDW